MKAIITAGGKGTRMRPLTFSTNKHFIPLANKPLLFYAIETIATCGISQIGINYNPGQLEEIKNFLGTGRRWGVKFSFILQEKPLGLANVVWSCREFLGKSRFVMYLGDNIFHGGIKVMVDRFKRTKANGMVAIVRHPENLRMGVPFFDKAGRLVKYVEKPKKAPHDWAVPGLYFADHNIFKCFSGEKAIQPSARGEYEISSPFQWLIDQGYRVETMKFEGIWKDPGKFDDWLETNQFLLDVNLKNGTETKLVKNVKVEGRVKIGKRCRIKNSILRGPMIVGDNVVIIDSFIGPYSSIGNDCRIIQAKLENSILAQGVKIINPKRPIDSSLIGQESVIEGSDRPFETTEVFIGNQCHLKL